MSFQDISAASFPVLCCMVITWFILVKLLLNRLKRFHPKKYQEMGRPSLFFRNNVSGGSAMLKYLITRDHKTLNDPQLSKLSDLMLVFLVIYSLIFFGLLFGFFAQTTLSAV